LAWSSLRAWWHGTRSSDPATASPTPAARAALAGPDDASALIDGRYRLGLCLGSGATAAVYLARDERRGTEVAIKLMALPVDDDGQALARVRREAEAARRLQHPDIVAVLDAGARGRQAWLVMEAVGGVDLSRYTAPARLLPEAVVLRLAARIADALAHAHARGVVHRDLKPANVLVDLPHDLLKLADFGVARLHDAAQTRTGLTLGTPAYMSPEQLVGMPASAAGDTYALGVMLFELLSGRRPYQAASFGELLRAIAGGAGQSLQQLRPDLPGELVDAVHRALHRDPAARPAELGAYAAELRRLAAAWAGDARAAAVTSPTPTAG
jgi:eukaryotic-like serine/threonine-protein kinase